MLCSVAVISGKRNPSMRRVTTLVPVAAAAFLATVLAGCMTPAPNPVETQRAPPADCPDELRERVRVAASAVAISLPGELSPQPGTGRPEELVARRLLISASPARDTTGVRVLGSVLTLYIVGGTF